MDWQSEAWPQHLEEVEASRPARSRDVKPSHTSSGRAVGRARRAQVAAAVYVFGFMFPCLCIVGETLLDFALLHKTTLVTCRAERVLSDGILDEFMHASLAQDMCLMLAVWRLTQLVLAEDRTTVQRAFATPLCFASHPILVLFAGDALGVGASCGWPDGVLLASTRHACCFCRTRVFRWCCWTRHFCWVSRSHAAQAWLRASPTSHRHRRVHAQLPAM